LRKLILGIFETLPNNTSWRFVDEEHTFLDAQNPWMTAIGETYEIDDLQTDMTIDFIGVKIGDVNNSVIANANEAKVDSRSSRWALTLNTPKQSLEQGEKATAVFKSDSYERVSGWQGTIEFDASKVEVLEINGKAITLSDDNYYLGRQGEGWLTISYHNNEIQDMDIDDEIFEIVYRAKTSFKNENLFELTSKVTQAEAYRGYNEEVNFSISESIEELAAILNVSPNPWTDYATVYFKMAKAGKGRWEMYDVNGRLIYTKSENYAQGDQTLIVKRTDINVSGIVYIKLITDDTIAEYKMMVIE